jgi:hypothetical protein
VALFERDRVTKSQRDKVYYSLLLSDNLQSQKQRNTVAIKPIQLTQTGSEKLPIHTGIFVIILTKWNSPTTPKILPATRSQKFFDAILSP